MVAVAKNAEVLASRVRYFIRKERSRDGVLSALLDEIASPAYLFGGVVRDLAVYGKRELPNRRADIDIVSAARGRSGRNFFEGLEARFGVEKNRFGGFRVVTNRWKVDIWAAEDTWAFRHGMFAYESVESLLNTTITNWEAVLFRLDEGPLMCSPTYFDDIRSGYLDVVFRVNPNPLGMYVRLFRACLDWPVSRLSGRAAEVVREAIESYSFDGLKRYEERHYTRLYIERRAYDQLAEAVLGGGSGDVLFRRVTVAGRLVPAHTPDERWLTEQGLPSADHDSKDKPRLQIRGGYPGPNSGLRGLAAATHRNPSGDDHILPCMIDPNEDPPPQSTWRQWQARRRRPDPNAPKLPAIRAGE